MEVFSYVSTPRYLSGFPWWLSGKEFTCNAGDAGSVPGLGRSHGQRSRAGYSPQGGTKSDKTEETEHAHRGLFLAITFMN